MNSILDRFGKQRGVSKTLFAIAIVGLIGITFFFVKIYLPPTEEDVLDNLESPSLSTVTAGTSDSLTPAAEIVTIEDAIDDLENLGISVVNVTSSIRPDQIVSADYFLKYEEFRKIAYRQKLAFLFYHPDNYLHKVLPLLMTSFENIKLVWFPEYETREYEETQSDYNGFEKVEIQSATCTMATGGANWTITLKLKNTGTAKATLISAFINEVEVGDYGVTTVRPGQTATNMTTDTSINSGHSIIVELYIADTYSTLTSGTTINIKIHSAGGMDYIKLVELV